MADGCNGLDFGDGVCGKAARGQARLPTDLSHVTLGCPRDSPFRGLCVVMETSPDSCTTSRMGANVSVDGR
jgi:hypothetical protein